MISRARLTVLFAATILSLASITLVGHAQNSSDYKIPDGFIKAPFDGFTGVLMLEPHRAAGMFVTYLEGKESADAMRSRLLERIGNMFIHDAGKNGTTIAWQSRSLMTRPEDGGGEAAMNLYGEGDKDLQVSIYERRVGPRPFLYGYFAMRHRTARKDDGEFLHADGKGVKAFEKLWKSFPK